MGKFSSGGNAGRAPESHHAIDAFSSFALNYWHITSECFRAKTVFHELPTCEYESTISQIV